MMGASVVLAISLTVVDFIVVVVVVVVVVFSSFGFSTRGKTVVGFSVVVDFFVVVDP